MDENYRFLVLHYDPMVLCCAKKFATQNEALHWAKQVAQEEELNKYYENNTIYEDFIGNCWIDLLDLNTIEKG